MTRFSRSAPDDASVRGTQCLERLGVRGGDRRRLEAAEPVEHLGRTAERVLHGVLLVEHHPDEQRERAVVEHRVGPGVTGDVDGHLSRP
jgi:hypothetical protein